MTENQNFIEAKKSTEEHIKFFESLLSHIDGPNGVFKDRAAWAAWCLHRYIQDQLMGDIMKAMKEHGIPKGEDVN